MSRRDELVLRDYLAHIQQAIIRIQRYLQGIDDERFLANEEKQDAVIRNLDHRRGGGQYPAPFP